jgi:predicted nuclease with TOPRIM domain
LEEKENRRADTEWQTRQTQAAAEALRLSAREREPLFDQAMELDARLREMAEPAQRIEKEYAATVEAIANRERSAADIEARRIQKEQQIAAAEQWLAEHAGDEKLAADLPLIETKREELRSSWTEKRNAVKEAEESAAALQLLQTETEQLEQRDAGLKEHLAQLQAQFKATAEGDSLLPAPNCSISPTGKSKNCRSAAKT